MKKLFFSICALLIFSSFGFAQTTEPSAADKAADKEAKAKMKQKQNEDIDAALSEAVVTKSDASKFREILKEYSSKSSEVKKNTFLTDDEKDERIKAINHEKNTKLEELIGAEKYRAYNAARKRQKEADAAAASATK